jgi:hypothetical protein
MLYLGGKFKNEEYRKKYLLSPFIVGPRSLSVEFLYSG